MALGVRKTLPFATYGAGEAEGSLMASRGARFYVRVDDFGGISVLGCALYAIAPSMHFWLLSP